MILVFAPDAPETLLQEACLAAASLGHSCEVSRGPRETVVVLSGTEDAEELGKRLASLGPVDLITLQEPGRYARLRTRRRFTGALVAGLGLFMTVGAAVPLAGFLLPPRRALMHEGQFRAADVAQLGENSARMVRFRGEPVLLVRQAGERYFALAALCPYMEDCLLEWSAERLQVVCPCHGDAFDLYGNVLRGPASVPLHSYVVERVGDGLYLNGEG